MKISSHELRCFCSRHPLLGKAGTDANGKPFVHVKVYKQSKLFAEIVVTEGVARLRCRECLRWYTVRIRPATPEVGFKEEPLPEAITV